MIYFLIMHVFYLDIYFKLFTDVSCDVQYFIF